MTNHILHPEHRLIHGGHGLVPVQTGQPLHVVPVVLLVEQLPEALLKAHSIQVTERDDLPRASRLHTEEVVKLVEEQWDSQHWDTMIDCLLDTVRPTMGHKHFGLRVSQEVLLWHPVNDQSVVAQSRGSCTFVPPDHLKNIEKLHLKSIFIYY